MRYRYKGSFTIEAALIMPVILGFIVLFVHLSFFCFDRLVIEYACRMSSAVAVYEDDPEEAASVYLHEILEKRLIGRWETDIDVYVDEDTLMTVIRATSALFDRTFEHTAGADMHFSPKY